jgi:hypothetical protein
MLEILRNMSKMIILANIPLTDVVLRL